MSAVVELLAPRKLIERYEGRDLRVLIDAPRIFLHAGDVEAVTGIPPWGRGEQLLLDDGTLEKAIAGGIGGATTAAGAAITTALADGALSEQDAWIVAGAIVAGFFAGFGVVWAAPANASSSGARESVSS